MQSPSRTFCASSQPNLLGSVSQSLVQWLMSGRPACDDPNASRMRSVGELASVQAIPRVFQSVLSLVDITDLTLSCEASPGNGCLAGVWCCMARLRTKWSRGSSRSSRRPASPSLRLLLPLCLHGLPLAPALLCGGIHSPASSMVAGFYWLQLQVA